MQITLFRQVWHVNCLTDYKVLHPGALHRVSDLNPVLQLDDKSNHFVHREVEDLEATRRLDVSLSVFIETDHSFIANLAPCVVWYDSKLALNYFRCDGTALIRTELHAELAQVLLKTRLNFIDT